MTFKAKSAKSIVTTLLALGGQNVKSVNQCKYLGTVLDTEISDDKDIQRQLRYQYYAANKLQASFFRCSNAVKNVLFRSFCTLMYAMHHHYGGISGSNACRDCVWLIILHAELHTTCRGERVLVAIRFDVILLHLKR